MKQFEVLATLFDTAAWALVNKTFNEAEQQSIIDELVSYIHAFNSGYIHEPFRKINKTWTQSGGSEGWSIAKTCLNKRKSFFVVLEGQMISMNPKECKFIGKGNALEMPPNNFAIVFGVPGTKVIRVFVKDSLDLANFMEKYHA